MSAAGDAHAQMWAVVDDVLRAAFAGDAGTLHDTLRRQRSDAGSPADAALLGVACAIAAVVACRFPVAIDEADAAWDAAADAPGDVRRLAAAALLMCDAMVGTDHAARRGIRLPEIVATLAAPGRGHLLACYLLAEAAMSAGAFAAIPPILRATGLAPGQISATPDGPVDGAALTLQLLLARSFAFQGHTDQARGVLDAISHAGARVPARAHAVVAAIAAFAAAGRADRIGFERLAGGVLRRTRGDVNYLSVGACFYVAWGMRALGQLQRAAGVLVAIAGADLERSKLWDQAFGLELLIEASLERGDLASAKSQVARAAHLARFPVAAASVARAESIVAASDGHRDDARTLALAAIRLDEGAGAHTEVMRGKLVHAAAIADDDPASAARLLAEVAAEADAYGLESVRLVAARRWRRLRETHPELAGEIVMLTARQRQIGALLAEGHSNRAIAEALFLSPRTVQAHISDMLEITGARSRVSLAARIGSSHGTDLSALSPRQREIAGLIADGRRNAEIAHDLGLSEKTVENHIAAMFTRLGVRSRSAVAAAVPTAGVAG
ncbi:MAG: helix-turn-helix transcriptional regulator [Microbacterium ginsengisoli]|nr:MULTISPECIES: LuxR C-terminal-related transcriptional regulator [unclassified Microbacterium]MBN9198407.1 helix-turn-helix transcriptional regulator [Microbacterium ginsengisoli]KQR95793.1 hypothetical protein ASG00_13960 [Microbacterium sp. Leaf351]KQR99082.1 hypothetical protein ASF93_12510 [Microbacterium sp. Leaf347]ODU74105.1 MAG: hypothetical protein ABT08_11140 [Microbacterium sp. SCN 71-21]OJU78180.1 MAG: hypothetical protein BGO15_03045 [Microbacterium sp. 71-23]